MSEPEPKYPGLEEHLEGPDAAVSSSSGAGRSKVMQNIRDVHAVVKDVEGKAAMRRARRAVMRFKSSE